MKLRIDSIRAISEGKYRVGLATGPSQLNYFEFRVDEGEPDLLVSEPDFERFVGHHAGYAAKLSAVLMAVHHLQGFEVETPR